MSKTPEGTPAVPKDAPPRSDSDAPPPNPDERPARTARTARDDDADNE